MERHMQSEAGDAMVLREAAKLAASDLPRGSLYQRVVDLLGQRGEFKYLKRITVGRIWKWACLLKTMVKNLEMGLSPENYGEEFRVGRPAPLCAGDKEVASNLFCKVAKETCIGSMRPRSKPSKAARNIKEDQTITEPALTTQVDDAPVLQVLGWELFALECGTA